MAAIVTPSTLKLYLAQRLRDAILSGKYKPGERLNESMIAREFDISRIPVREALFQLQESGLVTNHKHRGVFVTVLSEEDTQRINSVRMVLETEAMRLARAHMTPEVAASLSALVDKMESWSGQMAEAAELDLKFHRTIWEAAGNPYLVKTLDSLMTVLFAHKTIESVSYELRQWRLNHHRALLDAILDPGEPDIAGALLIHLRMAYKDPERFSSLAKVAPAGRRPGGQKGRTAAGKHMTAAETRPSKLQLLQGATAKPE
jgi:DNA-binding GntR family transcriptional regulator